MTKDSRTVFDGHSKVHNDSEGNQWIDIQDLTHDPQVTKDLTRLHDGFLAEQQYRHSVKAGDAPPNSVEGSSAIAQEQSHQRSQDNAESVREESNRRFRENESS